MQPQEPPLSYNTNCYPSDNLKRLSGLTRRPVLSQKDLLVCLGSPFAPLKHKQSFILAGKTWQRHLHHLDPILPLPRHVLIHRHALESRISIAVLCAHHGDGITLVSTDQTAREAALAPAPYASPYDRIHQQQHHVPAPIVPLQPLHPVRDAGVVYPVHPPLALHVVYRVDREPVPSEHEAPVAVARADVCNGPAVCEDPQGLQAFVGRRHAAKVVHEDGQDVVAHGRSLRARVWAAPLEVPARPGPEVKVRILYGRRFAFWDSKLREQACVDELVSRYVGGGFGPERALFGVCGEIFQRSCCRCGWTEY